MMTGKQKENERRIKKYSAKFLDTTLENKIKRKNKCELMIMITFDANLWGLLKAESLPP